MHFDTPLLSHCTDFCHPISSLAEQLSSLRHTSPSPSPSPSFLILPIHWSQIFHLSFKGKRKKMAKSTRPILLLPFFIILVLAAYVVQGSRTQVAELPHSQRVNDFSTSQGEQLKQRSKERMNYVRRLMIGSTAPTCTYNECRGCKYKCRAEQVPVEGNDPINSAYHYRCVCHG